MWDDVVQVLLAASTCGLLSTSTSTSPHRPGHRSMPGTISSPTLIVSTWYTPLLAVVDELHPVRLVGRRELRTSRWQT
jgi:hypothetical protein